MNKWREKKHLAGASAAVAGSRRWVRMLALGAAAMIGLSGLATTAPAQALGSVAAGQITIPSPNPVAYIQLNADFSQQYNSRTLGGNAFYQNGASASAYPVVVDLVSRANLARGNGTRTFGGSGTAADPYWLQTSGPLASPNTALTLTQKLSYVTGSEYMRNDISITNNSAAARSLQFGQYADCYFNGSDSGTSNIVSGLMVQCVKGDKSMSLIDSSGGAAFAGGHYGGSRTAVQAPLVGTANADKCWSSATAIGSCDLNLDNGFGMVWAADIAPGTTAARTSYLSYTADLAFIDLIPGSSVAPGTVSVGETVDYKLSLTNNGPDAALNNEVAFALPAGMSFETATGTGSYNAATGTWAIPSLAVGESVSITVTALANVPGVPTTQVTATSSDGIDPNACQITGSCGDPLTVTVLETGTAAMSQITAAPDTVTADGATTSTVTVTAFDAAGERVTIGGATVELDSDLGTLSDVVDNLDGSYTATITSTVSGTATISFTLNGKPGPATTAVEFVAGAIDPANAFTKYTVSEGEKVVDQDSHTVTVTLADQFGNPALGRAAELTASTEDELGAGEISDFTATGTAGEYQAAVTSTISGAKAISVRLDSEEGEDDEDGLPVTLEGNGSAVFIAGAADASNEDTKFAVSTGAASVAGGSHTVTVTVTDEFGNPAPGYALKLTAASEDDLGSGEITPFAETATAGTYTATVTSSISGAKAITVELMGANVTLSGNGNALFAAGAVDLTNDGTGYSVSGGEVSVAGGSHTVTVTLADEFGNPVPEKAAELAAATANALGTGVITPFVESATAGTYTATVTSSVSGGKIITAEFGGTALTLEGNNTAEFISGGVSVANDGTKYAVSTGDQIAGSGSHTVTVTLTDADNNPVLGQAAGLSASTSDALGAGDVTEFTATSTPGVYTATVTSTVSGAKAIQVAFGGDAVTLDGNRDAVFVAAGVDLANAGSSYAVSSGDETVGSGSHTVTVKLVDEFGNPVPGLAAKFDVATADELGAGSITDVTETETPGTYTATVTSTVIGSKAITLELSGSAVTLNGNGAASFISAGVNTTNAGTSYAVSTGDVTVNQGSHTVTVKLADEFGNPVPGMAAKLAAATADALGTGEITDFTETEVPGTYAAEITSTVSGGKLITVEFDGSAVQLEGNDTAEFVAAGASVANAGTQYAVSTGDEIAGSGSHTVTVKLADEFGNVVPGLATKLAAVTADALGAGEITEFAETGTPGTYTASVTSTVTGAKAITVEASGDSVRLEGNGDAVFIAAAVDLTGGDTQYAVSTGDQIAGSGSHTVTVMLVDGFGNAVPGMVAKLAAATENALGAGEITDFTESETPGSYTATVTSTVAGGKAITVEFDGNAVNLEGNDTAEFISAGVNLANPGTSYAVTGGDELVGTGSHTVTVQLADEFDNAVPGQAAELSAATADALGTGAITEFTETETPGSYTATVTSTVAGGKAITVEFDGNPVTLEGNDTAEFISAGVNTTNAGTSFSVSGGEVSVADGSHTVTVKLADEFGNPVPAQAAKLAAATEDALGSGVITPFVESATAGTYSATITSSVSGGKVVTVALDGAVIALDGNGTAEFISGGVSVGNDGTKYSVSLGNQEVGSGSHQVTVTLTDADNNPVPGQAAGLKASTTDVLGAGEITDFAETGTPGIYTATITSTVSGAKAIQVAFGGDAVALDGNRDAAFIAAGVELAGSGTSYVVSTGDKIAGSGSHTVTVTLVDEFDNAVPGLAAKLGATTADALGAGEITDFTESETPGSYTATVTSTVAGGKEITVTFSGEAVVLDGNDTAAFIAAGVNVANSGTSYAVSSGDEIAGSGSHTVTVKLADEFGNAVPGQAAKLAAATADALGTGRITAFTETETPGSYAATVTSTVAGGKAITAEFDGSAVTLEGNGTASFVAADVNLANDGTSYSVSAGDEVAGAGSHTVTVVLADEFGNAVPFQAAQLVAVTEDALGTGVITAFVESGTPGTYTATVTSTVSGGKLVTVQFGGEEVTLEGNDTAVFVAAAVNLGNAGTQYAVSTGNAVAGSGSHTVTVDLVDEFGNAVPGQAAKLVAATADALGAGGITSFSETAPGSYFATVTSTVVGGKAIEVEFDGAAVTLEGNGTAEFISAGVDVTNAGTGYTVSTGDEIVGSGSHSMIVTLSDEFGNPVPGLAEKLSATAAQTLGEGTITSFEETSPGSYTATITSTGSGVKAISASFFGQVLRATGNSEARFVEGALDSSQTTITVTPRISADGEDTGTITVSLFDSFGNPITEEMLLSLNTSIGEITGLNYQGNGVYTAQLRSTIPGHAEITAAIDGETLDALAEVDLINRVAPPAPVLDSNDGTSVTGCAAPGSTVTIRDAQGNVIGTAVAGDDCRFEVQLNPAQEPGSHINVTATDKDGNESIAAELLIGLITLDLRSAELHPGETQIATGHLFQPGETVTAVLRSTPVTIGEAVADADGNVSFEFTVPADIELGEHSVTLSGDFSGDVRETFQVVPVAGLAITGGDSMLLLGGAALLVLVVGGTLVIVARRRRAEK